MGLRTAGFLGALLVGQSVSSNPVAPRHAPSPTGDLIHVGYGSARIICRTRCNYSDEGGTSPIYSNSECTNIYWDFSQFTVDSNDDQKCRPAARTCDDGYTRVSSDTCPRAAYPGTLSLGNVTAVAE